MLRTASFPPQSLEHGVDALGHRLRQHCVEGGLEKHVDAAGIALHSRPRSLRRLRVYSCQPMMIRSTSHRAARIAVTPGRTLKKIPMGVAIETRSRPCLTGSLTPSRI